MDPPLSHSSAIASTDGHGSTPLSHSSFQCVDNSETGPDDVLGPLSYEIQPPDMLCEPNLNEVDKLGKLIVKALWMEEDVKEFDSVRHIIKVGKQHRRKVSHTHIHDYEVLKINKKEAPLRSYEHDYFRRHGVLPTQDRDEHYRLLVKQRNLVKWLLSTWENYLKFTVHTHTCTIPFSSDTQHYTLT